MKKIIGKKDIILIVSLLIIAACTFFVIRIMSDPGTLVVVRVDGEDIASYPIDRDTTVIFRDGKAIDPDDESFDPASVKKSNLSYYNIMQIVNGEVSVIEADCPDKICVHHNPISNDGESIICLPHKFSVHIREEAD